MLPQANRGFHRVKRPGCMATGTTTCPAWRADRASIG